MMLACAVALAAYAKITLNRWLNLGIKEYIMVIPESPINLPAIL